MMPIQFDPNIDGFIKHLIAQGVTEEAARKALGKYFAEHGDEILEKVRAEMANHPWKDRLASHGYSLATDHPQIAFRDKADEQ